MDSFYGPVFKLTIILNKNKIQPSWIFAQRLIFQLVFELD